METRSRLGLETYATTFIDMRMLSGRAPTRDGSLQQMQDQGVWQTEILDESTLHKDPAECFSWKLRRGGLRIHELGAVHLRSLIVKTLMFYRLKRQ
jgi:hypothetical protein